MSAHFSKFGLNTYTATPYFQAQIPEGFDIGNVLIAARAYRNLPPNIKTLAGKAKQWAKRVYADHSFITEIDRWYDEEGNELDPDSGEILTNEQIEESWKGLVSPGTKFKIKDIPIPKGGFADPDTWEQEPEEEEESAPYEGPTEDKLVQDIGSHGREYTARYYGIPPEEAKRAKSDKELAHMIFEMLNGSALSS